MSLVKEKLVHCAPKKPWEETPEDFYARLRKVAQEINSGARMDELCREWPQRLHDLVHVTKGDRLRK